MVRETVDLDSVGSYEYVLLPSLDEELQETREAILETVNQLDQEHKRVGKDLGLDTEKKLHLENHQVHNYSLRITKAVSQRSSRQPELMSGSGIAQGQEGVYRARDTKVGHDLYDDQDPGAEREVCGSQARLREETEAFGERGRADRL